jgi:hypothetical protein
MRQVLNLVPAIKSFNFKIQVDAGESFAQSAQQWYAQRYVDSNTPSWQKPLYFAGGLFTSLWTPCSSDATTAVLTTAWGVAKPAANNTTLNDVRGLLQRLKGTGNLDDAGAIGRLQEGNIVNDLLFGARPGQGLPGASGAKIPSRPTPAQLELLTDKHNVEFAVTYKLGSGPNGRGGQYFLYSGNINSVRLPLEADSMFIYHTHPGGTAAASQADKNFLEALELLGSPQRSSQIVPSGKDVIRFNKSSSRL